MRHSRPVFAPLPVVCLLALFAGFVPRAQADTSLTIELPPSQAALDARAGRERAVVRTNVTPHPNSVSSRTGRSRSRTRSLYPSRHAGARQEQVVGRLGQLPQATPIYRSRSTSSARLTVAPAGTYIALQQESGDWFGVLMADGSTGWLPQSSVTRLDYQVVSANANPAQSSVPPGAMPGGEGDIYPRTSSPYFVGDAQQILSEAYKYLGVPYVWGGNTGKGIDCSGLVKNVFTACGYPLPRLGSDQMAYGIAVTPDQLQPGDRLYFGRRTERLGVKHTAIYIGNGYFIQASSSRHGVVVSRLDEPMYRRMYVCARR